MYPTIADSFDAWVDADRGQKERIRIYDIQGQVFKIYFPSILNRTTSHLFSQIFCNNTRSDYFVFFSLYY